MKLTIIRHGTTTGNEQRLYYGQSDLPLSEAGFKELEKLAREGGYPKVSRIITSGLLRTEQTFKVLFGDIPHETLEGLREMNLGDFEMRPYDELKTDPKYIEWITGDNEANVCPNGESGNMATERALNALLPIINGNEDVLCISHGGIIGGLMARWFPVPEGRFAYSAEGGHGFTIEFEGGKPISYREAP